MALAFADIAAEVSGVYPQIMQQGEMDAGVWSCGMVAGLIHDITTVRELIDRIMAEAENNPGAAAGFSVRPDVVQAFRPARHGGPEGPHYLPLLEDSHDRPRAQRRHRTVCSP